MSDANSNSLMPWTALFRLSLRDMLILIAILALAIASFRYASESWRTFVYAMTMVVFFFAVVVVVVDRGQQQAFAIGMVLLMAMYAVAVYFEGPDQRQLPTTGITRFFYQRVVTTKWIDRKTREPIPNLNPANPPPGSITVRSTSLSPKPHLAMPIAHCWWALLLAYVGGRLARGIYLRRTLASTD